MKDCTMLKKLKFWICIMNEKWDTKNEELKTLCNL